MIKKLFCSVLIVATMAAVVVKADEQVGIEVRKRSVIGRLGLVRAQVVVKPQADGTAVVSFQAPEPGTYVLAYTNGPDRGKTAATVRVEKAGPVTAKIKPGRR